MSIPVRTPASRPGTDPWQRRVDSGDWDAITAEVNAYGGALLPQAAHGYRDGPHPLPV